MSSSTPEPNVHSLHPEHPRRIAFMDRLLSDYHEEGKTGVEISRFVSFTVLVQEKAKNPFHETRVSYRGEFILERNWPKRDKMPRIFFAGCDDDGLFESSLNGTYSSMIPFWKSISHVTILTDEGLSLIHI